MREANDPARQTAWNTLQPLFRPRSVAVIGASPKQGPGLQALENLRQLQYDGEVYPINPKYEEIMGLRCYASLSALKAEGKHPELLAILLGRDNILPVIEEAAACGVKAAWAFAAGFGEADEEGKALSAKVKALCEENGIRFLGPNCVGFLNPPLGSCAYSAPAPSEIVKGRIGMVAQSGYLNIAVANSARGLGFSLMVSTGNEMVVDSTDVMEYMLEDPHTDVIMAFIEQIRRPEAFRAVALRALELQKPILLIKVGRSEMAQRATTAHTGALAGSDAIQDKLFQKLGVIRVDDFDELFETAELLSKLKGKLPKGNGIFAVTLSGGVISLMADVGDNMGLRFPAWSQSGIAEMQKQLMTFSHIANPLDAWGSGHIESTYAPCLHSAAAEKDCDLLLVVQDVPAGMADRQVEQYAIVANATVEAARLSRKPTALITNISTGVHPKIQAILDRGNVPALRGTRAGLKAVKNAIRYAKAVMAPAHEECTGKRSFSLSPFLGKALTEYQSKKVLSSFGIACTREILAPDPDACAAAAREIGYPVVLKVMSPQILHKTEAKVIAVGLADELAVREAYPRLMQNALRFAPNAQIDGMLVQEMAEEPVAEVILGITRDAQFGPAVVYGTGGILVEVLKDSTLGIPPFNEEEALEMIRSTKGYRLLTGFRGREKADVLSLAKTLVQVGRLAAECGDEIAALDINPLLVYGEGKGVLAVDALLELR
ncbi:MAG TPA: acetate--CoA ligase family protein [Clostridia bacterium]|nr:acetate--CoA ligase family protein [Clostridia bacterium]